MMIGTLLIEGLKDAFPLIEKFAPSVGAILRHHSSIAGNILLPMVARAFGADSALPAGLNSLIANHPQAEAILRSFEADYAPFLTGLLRPMRSVKIEVEWCEPTILPPQ